MACYRPLKAYRAPDGKIAFDSKTGYFDAHLQLACGQCIGCRMERRRSWAIRAMHEAQITHELAREAGSQKPSHSCFLTLTYDDRRIPEDALDEDGEWTRSLYKHHWQNFAKKVRRDLGKFRYLHCGEYGDANGRPHYHALVFGHDFSEDSLPLERGSGGLPLRVSAYLTEAWPHGYHSIGTVDFQSASYVAKYTTKKKTGDLADTNERVDPTTGLTWTVNPEYATMSRNPGLGKAWFDRYHKDVYPSNHVIINGKPFKPPSFYDQLLERRDPALAKRMRTERQGEIRKTIWDYTDERLDTKAELAERRLKNSQR